MFLPEQLVLSVNEYTMQQQKNSAARFQQGHKESKKNDATEEEKRLAKEFGMSVAEYRLRQRDYVDAAKQGKDDRKAHEADGLKIGEEGNEEQKSAGGGMMGGGGRGVGNNELTDMIQVMNYAGPGGVRKERLEKEERALQEMKSQHQQRQQERENHEHQHGQHEKYQVIEGEIEESVVEDDYVQISPYVSSYEQDNIERGRGDNDQQQQPNLPVMAEGMRVQELQQSPRAQHLNQGGERETASLLSLLNDGVRNHNHRYDRNCDHQSHDDQDHRHYDYDNQNPNRHHQGHGYYNRNNQDHGHQDHGHQDWGHQDWGHQDWGHHNPPGHHGHYPDQHYPNYHDLAHPSPDHYQRPPDPGPPLDPHHQFTIGSMVRVDVQRGDPLYGVVKWIGTVPDYPGTIAGLEMVIIVII